MQYPSALIDTNIFLRHLLNDDPVKSPQCLRLFQEIEQGTLTGWTSDLVIAELVFILQIRKPTTSPGIAWRACSFPSSGCPT